jgi:hypothetical protein
MAASRTALNKERLQGKIGTPARRGILYMFVDTTFPAKILRVISCDPGGHRIR